MSYVRTGVRRGPKNKLTAADVKEIQDNSGRTFKLSTANYLKRKGISRSTYYRAVKALDAEAKRRGVA